MKYFKILFIWSLLSGLSMQAQVGIGTEMPQAQLDVSATDLAAPENTDGILIPRIDNFPAVAPNADQDSMMGFVTGNGIPTRGFYYWDQPSGEWLLVNNGANSNYSLTRVSLSNNQALNNTGAQKINYNNVIFDINNEFDAVNNRFIASQAGYYKVTASYTTVTQQTNSNFYGIGVYLNGAVVPYKESTHHHSYNAANNPSQVVREVTTVIYLDTNDFVEIAAINFQAGTVELDSFAGKTDVVIERIR